MDRAVLVYSGGWLLYSDFNVVRRETIGLKVGRSTLLITAETDVDDTGEFAGLAPRRFSWEAGFERHFIFATWCPHSAWLPMPPLGFYQVNGSRYFAVKASVTLIRPGTILRAAGEAADALRRGAVLDQAGPVLQHTEERDLVTGHNSMAGRLVQASSEACGVEYGGEARCVSM